MVQLGCVLSFYMTEGTMEINFGDCGLARTQMFVVSTQMFMKERLKAGFERLDGKFPELKWFEDHFSACMPKGASGALPKASIHESADEFAREIIVLWAQRALVCSRAARQSKIAPKHAGRTPILGDSAVV
jgi:hypothetical protein